MAKFKSPDETRERVREFLQTTQGTKYELDELREFLEMLKPSLVEKVSISIYGKTVRKNKILYNFVK
jgi:transposase